MKWSWCIWSSTSDPGVSGDDGGDWGQGIEEDDEYELAPFPDDNGVAVRIKRSGEFKKQNDNRDSLPYQIFETNSLEYGENEEETKKSGKKKAERKFDMGTFYLDPSVSCGEYLLINGISYVVKRVSFVYELKRNKHVVVSKKLDVFAVKSVFTDQSRDGNEILQ